MLFSAIFNANNLAQKVKYSVNLKTCAHLPMMDAEFDLDLVSVVSQGETTWD
jgi:hypothetical protein